MFTTYQAAALPSLVIHATPTPLDLGRLTISSGRRPAIYASHRAGSAPPCPCLASAGGAPPCRRASGAPTSRRRTAEPPRSLCGEAMEDLSLCMT
jgi:hypothetical protein